MDLDENEGQSPNNHRSFENLLAGAKTVLQADQLLKEHLEQKMKSVFY